MYFETDCEMAIQGHPRSFILLQIDSAYICNFLLVIISHLGPILPRFKDIASFLLRTVTPPPYVHIDIVDGQADGQTDG